VDGGLHPTLGERLREIRLERKESLAEVSRATAISTSFLSLVETGRSDITLGRLMRLVQFYGIHVNDLLREAPPDPAGVVRAGQEILVHSGTEGIDIRLLAPRGDRTLMPLLVAVQPGGHTVEATSYEGEEFVHVLEGELTMQLGEDEVLLQAGDTISYDTTTPHSISNPGRVVTRFIATSTPPHF
jgi:mannose-6-phosphate isomerase-like protein (cupin superfamily)/DNA-binding Xre family transcriptional regulator